VCWLLAFLAYAMYAMANLGEYNADESYVYGGGDAVAGVVMGLLPLLVILLIVWRRRRKARKLAGLSS
jgi:MYXO-CTERM domain-containing protein